MSNKTYEIGAGKFKANCLKLMEEVKQYHTSIIITKHGKPVAKLVPIVDSPVDYFGCLSGTVTINSDIVAPIDVSWEADQ